MRKILIVYIFRIKTWWCSVHEYNNEKNIDDNLSGIDKTVIVTILSIRIL